MPCAYPLHGFRGPAGGFLASSRGSPTMVPMVVPCGACIQCRLAKARDWQTRLTHEASLYEENMFVTLTYDDDHLPIDYSVNKRDLQLFMKRLRKSVEPLRVRYFGCGEYGDQTLRPHYHALIFNLLFSDRYEWGRNGDHIRYRSEKLEKLWPFGQAELGSVSPASAAYVASYSLKKVGGPPAPDHYNRIHPLTGEEVTVMPEFGLMSKRPFLGSGWLNKWERDCFPSDFVIINGQQTPVPRAYTRELKDRYLGNPRADPLRFIPSDDLRPYKIRRKAYALAANKQLVDQHNLDRDSIKNSNRIRKLREMKRENNVP